MRLASVAVLAFVVPCVAAPVVAAQPRIWIETIVDGDRFGRGGQCIAPGSRVVVVGAGFSPRGRVRLGRGQVRTSRDGAFSRLLEVAAPRRRAQERVVLRARQAVRRGGKRRWLRARLQYWTTVDGVDVPGWNTDGREARAVPGRAERARAGGFLPGRSLYVHYLREGQQVFAARVARLRGPCGAATFRFVQFGFAGPPSGLYQVDFGTRPTVDPDAGSGYRAVRLGAAPPPLPPVTAPLFTLAGGGSGTAPADGAPGAALRLRPRAALAARPGGGVFVGDPGRVWAIDATGRARSIVGNGTRGSTGDGGPATAARVQVQAIAPLGDALLIAQCDPAGADDFKPAGRIRRVGADGIITTIAGTGRHGDFRDGAVATATSIGCPGDVSAAPDGSVYVAVGLRVLRVAPDGTIARVAGSGDNPGSPRSGPARSTALAPAGLAALADGSVLIADSDACAVYRLDGGELSVVAGDGTAGPHNDDGMPATNASICPQAVAAAPDGGFYVADNGRSSAVGGEPRIRRITPDGRVQTVAGSGRWAPNPPGGHELRGDGMPGRQADLRALWDVAVLQDGGVAFSEAADSLFERLPPGVRDPGLVRYIPPGHDAMLAVALRRDRDRIFAAGKPARVTVSLTAPADVTVIVRDRDREVTRFERPLPAGDSVVELPVLAGIPHTVELASRDVGKRVAIDRAAILPRGWLTETLAWSVAGAVIFTATNAGVAVSDAVRRCTRFAADRLDCALWPRRSCAAVATIRLGADGRLRWGTYRCPIGRRHAVLKPLRRLRTRDYSCKETCDGRPSLFGVVPDRWLVPWD